MSAQQDHNPFACRESAPGRPPEAALFRRMRRHGVSGFTLIEMLVVIGIIALLAGILLVALSAARSSGLRLQTQTTMESFGRACDTFYQDHGFYPGPIPEKFLEVDGKVTSTEAAILHLMGGIALQGNPQYGDLTPAGGWERIQFSTDDQDFEIKVNINLIGEGPIINGKPYAPYFSPDSGDVAVAQGQQPGEWVGANGEKLPDLIDAWGQPIVYMRRIRDVGQLVGSADEGNNLDGDTPAQFIYAGIEPYTRSQALGEQGRNQDRSILNANSSGSLKQFATLAQLIRHPAFGEFDGMEAALNGEARGAYVLFSAGKDGVYFSIDDGPGSTDEPVSTILTGEYANPQVFDEYDDIRVFGGD